MAIKIASAAEIAAKWMETTPNRARYYESNTPGAAADWERETLASVEAYRAGISAAGIEKRFAGGVRKAGAAKFARKVIEVGKDRFAAGVRAALADMQAGFEPYQAVIAGLTLPRKGMRGDSGNTSRMTTVSEALFKKRLALLGAGS